VLTVVNTRSEGTWRNDVVLRGTEAGSRWRDLLTGKTYTTVGGTRLSLQVNVGELKILKKL